MRLPSDAALILVDCNWRSTMSAGARATTRKPTGDRRPARRLARGGPADRPYPPRFGRAGLALSSGPAEPRLQAGGRAAPRRGGLGKSAHSAFVGTALEETLDGLGATTLVICGVLTHNSVEATARHAADLGYRVFVVADACWAVALADGGGGFWPAEIVHRVALACLAGEYAAIVDAETTLAAARLAKTGCARGATPPRPANERKARALRLKRHLLRGSAGANSPAGLRRV